MLINYMLRFMYKFSVDTNTDCWNWNAATQIINKSRSIYKRGVFNFGGKTLKASRVSYILFVGDIPNGLMVCHRCDNSLCVNPDHLFLGSALDNYKDMESKGRNRNKQEQNGKHKLTIDEVKEIKNIYKSKLASQSKLGKMFGVSRSCIEAIISGINWKTVE